MDYKQQYLKYKKKYLLFKKITGGSIKTNEIKQLKTPKKIQEIECDNMIKVEHMKTVILMELEKLKNIYQKNERLKNNEIIELLKKIHNMAKNINQTYKYSIEEQYSFLLDHFQFLEDNKNINNIVLDNLVYYYIHKNNKIDLLYKYLKKNSDIKLNNKKIEKYSFRQLMGEGVFAKVYSLSNNKVIKIINTNMYNLAPNDEYLIDSLINEINIMNKIKNTNIGPKIFDYWMSKNKNILNVYIVMEYKGITLNKWLLNNKLTETHKKKIKNKIKRLHEMNIIHNDLHEDNILVDKNKNGIDFFISDFGLSETKKNLFERIKKEDYNVFLYINENYKINQYLSLVLKLFKIKIKN